MNERLADLLARLDDAVSAPDTAGICRRVTAALMGAVSSRDDFLSPELLKPAPADYARRLIHRDPAGRYTVLAMVWGVDQGTPLHDHAGMWCVECVYRGRIRVTSYDLVDSLAAEPLQFTRKTEVLAGVGEAGALIPPFEYHTIHNANPDPSVTIHVYGGEMSWCHAFVPVPGGYRRERRRLHYTA